MIPRLLTRGILAEDGEALTALDAELVHRRLELGLGEIGDGDHATLSLADVAQVLPDP